MRSNDDSMPVVLARTPEDCILQIERNRQAMKIIGINISVDKTLIFREEFGEYISSYQDGKFVAQYGTEVATLRPAGKNPVDDFFGIAKQTSVSLMKIEFNLLGAEFRIIAGLANCRRLYRIRRKEIERHQVRDKIMLLADGGASPWNSMMCHLEEVSLKRH